MTISSHIPEVVLLLNWCLIGYQFIVILSIIRHCYKMHLMSVPGVISLFFLALEIAFIAGNIKSQDTHMINFFHAKCPTIEIAVWSRFHDRFFMVLVAVLLHLFYIFNHRVVIPRLNK